MNYLLLNFVIALWIEVITSLFIAVFLLIKGTKKNHKLYALESFSVCWWCFCQVCLITSTNKAGALIWARVEQIGVFFIPTFFLHFIISFLEIKNKKWIILSSYFASILFGYLSIATEYMIVNAMPQFYVRYFKVPGPLYHFAIIFFFISAVYAFLLLFDAYQKATYSKRNQTKYLWWSMLIAYTGGIPNFIFAYHINIPYLPFLTYFGSFGLWLMTYAILRHHLMDINIVIKRTAIYSILVTLITITYFIIVYTMESIFRDFVGYKSIPWTLGIIALFILIFQPLKNLIQSFVDKYFFKTSQGTLAEELQKTQEELKRAERLKAVGTLAAGMAHEIKNPLTGIKTFAEYLPEKYNDPAFVEKFHKIVTTEVNKINEIVQQLLDFSKPKPLQLQQVNIHQIIDQTLSLLSNSLVKYKITLVRNYDTSLPSTSIDPNQMQQVFCNLFLNAIEAMKKGGKLTITTTQVNSVLELTISDTGEGISQKDLEHIFDPFYTTKEGGTGLGMSIIYGIIKEHKGEIKVESEERNGTNFILKFPI